MLDFPSSLLFSLYIIALQTTIFVSLFCNLKDFLFIANNIFSFEIIIISACSNTNLFSSNFPEAFNFLFVDILATYLFALNNIITSIILFAFLFNISNLQFLILIQF